MNADSQQPQGKAEISDHPYGERTPTIEAIHFNISLANQYRLEMIKHLLAIAAALLAFTVTFRPTLVRVELPWVMWIAWFGLGISIVGGVFHMLGWDHFYKSYRDFDGKSPDPKDPKKGEREGDAARKRINLWRRFAMAAQFIGFIVGVASVAIFASLNIDNVRKLEESLQPPHQQLTAPTEKTPGSPADPAGK